MITLLLIIFIMLFIPIYALGEDNTSTAKIPTVITWTNQTDKPFVPSLGGPHQLSVSLIDVNGNPLSDKNISWQTYGAYLAQNLTSTDQNGVCQNDGIKAFTPVWIEYWSASDYKVIMTSSDMIFNYPDYIERTLTGLKPGTIYWYRVRSGVGQSEIDSFTNIASSFSYITSKGIQTYA
jgi:hypothetical protein